MHAEPQAEHKWLDRLVGQWESETEASMGPDQPPGKFTGTETTRSLGGMWVLCEGRGEMPGGGVMLTLMTLGYDPAKKAFVGTFVGSMMTHLWVYDGGTLDESGTVLTLNAEGPSFADPAKTAKYHDIIELTADRRLLKSEYLGDDGAWHEFMVATYRRVG